MTDLWEWTLPREYLLQVFEVAIPWECPYSANELADIYENLPWPQADRKLTEILGTGWMESDLVYTVMQNIVNEYLTQEVKSDALDQATAKAEGYAGQIRQHAVTEVLGNDVHPTDYEEENPFDQSSANTLK